MFLLLFTIIFSLPGLLWSIKNKEDPSFRYRWKHYSIIEIISTISWPFGYLFILLTPYSIIVKVLILIALHFLVLPMLSGLIQGMIVKKSLNSKIIAIIGIISYILGVITSVSDDKGNFVLPIVLIVISWAISMIFVVMATIRLWKIQRPSSIIFVSSTIIFYALTALQEIAIPKYESFIIILLNITKVINFLIYIYAIWLLLEMTKNESKKHKIADATS